MLNKFIVTLLIVVSFSTKGALSLIPSLGSYRLATAGLAAIGGGYGYAYLTYRNGCDEFDCHNAIVKGWLLGLVLLDSKNSKVKFSELSLENTYGLNISSTDLEIYNSEIEEINTILEHISLELDSSSSVEKSKELWTEYSVYFSEETFNVMQEIAKNSL